MTKAAGEVLPSRTIVTKSSLSSAPGTTIRRYAPVGDVVVLLCTRSPRSTSRSVVATADRVHASTPSSSRDKLTRAQQADTASGRRPVETETLDRRRIEGIEGRGEGDDGERRSRDLARVEAL